MAESKNLRLDTNDEARGLAEMVLRTCRYGALAWIEPGTGVPVTSRVGCQADRYRERWLSCCCGRSRPLTKPDEAQRVQSMKPTRRWSRR